MSGLAVAVVGHGAIGKAVAGVLADGGVAGCSLTAVLDSRATAEQVTRVLTESDVVVEATRVEAAPAVIGQALALGKDVVVCSCGVFADDAFARSVAGLGGRMLLPPGAIGGFDVLAAAVRAGTEEATIRHTTIKHPAALGLDAGLSTPVEVFHGTAREAALRFPRTSNSSVALGLATMGLDRLEVVVRADPAAQVTRHVIEWRSEVGCYELSFENAVDASSGGRTSAITAWSVVEVLHGLGRGVGPGAVVIG